MRSKVLFSLLLLIIASTARAQDVQPVAENDSSSSKLLSEPEQSASDEPARLAIYFDLFSHSRSIALQPGEQAQFSVVAEGSAGGIKAWEAQVVLGKGIMVLKREADGLNMGSKVDGWRVGLGKECKQEQQIVLATYTVTIAPDAGHDLVLGLAPVANGSFHPPSPGYLACKGIKDLRAFAYADTAAVINPVKVQLAPAGAPKKAQFEMGKARG